VLLQTVKVSAAICCPLEQSGKMPLLLMKMKIARKILPLEVPIVGTIWTENSGI